MRTLIFLDPNSIDILKKYLVTRDGEHEEYCEYFILPEFTKIHGWQDVTAIRFGIFVILNMVWAGQRGFDINKYGLMDAAPKIIEPGEFARILIEEAIAYDVKSLWNFHAPHWYIDNFASKLNRDNTYQGEILRSIVKQLIEAITKHHNKVEEYRFKIIAVRTLAQMRVTEPLIDLLGAPNTGIKPEVVRILGQLNDIRAIKPLIAILKKPHSTIKEGKVRVAAIKALTQMGATEAVPELIKLLYDQGAKLILVAIRALAQLNEAR